tara:strand:- start:112104 stop:112265 length:162 start_codon:yes stop_codon:yes gene_type:complete
MIKRLVELRIVTFIAVLITVVLLVGVAIGALFFNPDDEGVDLGDVCVGVCYDI